MRFRLLLLFSMLLLSAGIASANMMSCYYIYTGDSVSCVDSEGGSYCEVIPEYDVRCFYSSDVGGSVPSDPYIPPGGGDVPTYVDPAWMYIEYIDDTEPENIKAVVNADPRLDSFALYMNGAPYGTGWGTGRVAVGSLPASAFNAGDANISVQGCGYQTDLCAAASANTYVQDDQKVESGTVVVGYPEQDTIFSVASYNRSHVVQFKRRSYTVWSSPGNTQFTFKKALTALSYTWLGGQRVLRNEELTWKVTPGSWWANTCAMTGEPDSGESLDQPYTTTDWVSCHLGNAVGAAGNFNSSITWIARQQYEGLNTGGVFTGGELGVNVP